MSFWTEFRDDLETAAAVVSNYFYPGSGLAAQFINSKGSQAQLNTVWGQAAMMGSGLAGGASGNFSNYGTTYDAITGANTAAGAGAGYGGGFTGTGTIAADPGAVDAAQRMMAQGVDAGQALQTAGLTPAQAEAAGLVAPAGSTWQDVSQQSGIPYGNGAINGMSGTATIGPNSAFGGSTPTMTAAKATGAMPWGSPGNVSSMGSGVAGLIAAGNLMGAAGQAQRTADPFGPYRSQYADLMSNITNDPSQIQKLPGYQAGLQAVQRSLAAQGYTGSGNMMAAMAKYGGDFYNNAMQLYGGLSGAQFNPASAAQLGLQGKQSAISLAGNSLNRLGYGATMAGGWGG